MRSNYVKKYLNIIQQKYPLIDLNNLKKLDESWDFIIYLTPKNIAFRFPRRKKCAKRLILETNFLNEFSRISSIKTPELKLEFNPDLAINYAVYEFLPGLSLSKDLISKFSNIDLDLFAKDIGVFLSDLHSFSIDKARSLNIKEINSMKFWQTRRKTYKKKIYPYLSQKEIEWVENLFHNFFNLLQKSKYSKVVCHSDLKLEHFIIEEKSHRLTGVIDFEAVQIDDPAIDFQFFQDFSSNFLYDIYKNYNLTQDPNFDLRRKFYENEKTLYLFELFLAVKNAKLLDETRKKLAELIKKEIR